MFYVKFFIIMSTTILNFKKVEIVAESKEAAKAEMESKYFHYVGDATQAFKNFKESIGGAVTERAIKEFMLTYLEGKTKNAPGSGFLITLDAAVKDTRERPYRIVNVKNTQGKRKMKRVYVWKDVDTDKEIISVDTNKADAENKLKEVYATGSYKGHAKLFIQSVVAEGQDVVAEAFYTPSAGTKNGQYLAFGIEA